MIWQAFKALEKSLNHSIISLIRVITFMTNFRLGKENGYPTCCVIQFSWDQCHRNPRRFPAIRRGTIHYPGTNTLFVPCSYHMRHPLWKAFSDRASSNQIQLFEETQDEAQDRRRRRCELEDRHSNKRSGRPR